MLAPGPWLGTSSYWKAVILLLMSVWATASTNRVPRARLKQRTAARACSLSPSRTLSAPACSRYSWAPWREEEGGGTGAL